MVVRETQVLPENPVVDLYPNPLENTETLFIKPDRNMTVQFYTALGQTLSESHFVPANQEYPVLLTGLSPGIYLARFTYNGKTLGKRFIIN